MQFISNELFTQEAANLVMDKEKTNIMEDHINEQLHGNIHMTHSYQQLKHR